LGILEKDENITEQMVEIVEHLQQYVPRTTDNKIIPILLGGDALSVERGEAARRARSDSFSPEDRLDGLVNETHMKFPGKPYTNLTIGNCTSVTNKEGTDGGPHHHIS
jgi:hypothetical protein